jgi:hypothetical protein
MGEESVMKPRLSWVVAGLMVIAAYAVGACGDYSALSAPQADSLGEELANDVSAVAELAAFDPSTGVSLAPAAPGSQTAPPCQPAVTPASPTNGDSDPVPDSVRVDFTGCSFTRGQFLLTFGGTIDVLDPNPTTTAFAVEFVFGGFSETLTNTQNARSISSRVSGTTHLAGSPDTVGLTLINLTSRYRFANGDSAIRVVNWTGKFTADTAGTIHLGSPLPIGLLTLNGSATWTKQATLSGTTSTPVPLHYDPTCTVRPRLDHGRLVERVTLNQASSTVTVDFTACGQFTVTRT